MAGIGFELKKIYRKESISRGMLGVVYSSLVTIGPMILVIVAILLLYFFLGMRTESCCPPRFFTPLFFPSYLPHRSM